MRLLRQPANRVVLASLVTQGSLVVSGPLVVRAVGVEGRGELAFAYAVVLFASLVMPMGLPQALAFHIAARRGSARTLLGLLRARYFVLTAGAAVAGGSFLGLAYLLSGDDDSSQWVALPLVVLGIVAVMMSVLWMASLQGQGRFTALAVTQVIVGPAYAIGVLAVWLFDAGSVPLLLALNVGAWVVVALLGRSLVMRSHPSTEDERREEKGQPKDAANRDELVRYGWRAWVASSAPIDNLGIDQLLVAMILTHYALGQYAVGLAFESGPVLVLVAVATVALQRVSAAATPRERSRMVRLVVIGAVIIVLLTIISIQAVLEPVLVFAFGEEARSGVEVARILVLAGGLLGMRRVLAAVLQGLGRPYQTMLGEAAGFVTMLVGMVVVAPNHGVEGAGWSLVAAGAVATAVQGWALWRFSGPRAAQPESLQRSAAT